ncbi:hypothetical protein PRVXT_002710 [Proteinivorax tanatarense]|uniref:Uncharacterized protein n=1 Tax=Proteinivorax tanatarense TaxID=1260629 RepID=A0AAU7VLC3_9FIRM
MLKKRLMMVTALVLGGLLFFAGMPVHAAEEPLYVDDSIKHISNDVYLDEPDSISGVKITVFLSGVVVAYVIDGVIIHTTGQSGGEWVADAFDFITQFPTLDSMHLEDQDNISHGFTSQGCRVTPDGHSMCPFSLEKKELAYE